MVLFLRFATVLASAVLLCCIGRQQCVGCPFLSSAADDTHGQVCASLLRTPSSFEFSKGLFERTLARRPGSPGVAGHLGATWHA
jgi:hypothetical protein